LKNFQHLDMITSYKLFLIAAILFTIAVAKKHSGGGLQVKVIKDVDKGKLGYITKQCHGRKHPFSGYPAYTGDYITGQRYALSPSLAAMVAHLPTPRAARVCLPKQNRLLGITAQSVPVISAAAIFTFEPSGQGCLFTPTETPVTLHSLKQGKLPPAVVIDLEQKRRERGLTQEAVAAAIGVKRVTLCNAINGRYGLSKEPLARLKVLLAA
jgi:DNA-binding XRE family transcriptional regulator